MKNFVKLQYVSEAEERTFYKMSVSHILNETDHDPMYNDNLCAHRYLELFRFLQTVLSCLSPGTTPPGT